MSVMSLLLVWHNDNLQIPYHSTSAARFLNHENLRQGCSWKLLVLTADAFAMAN